MATSGRIAIANKHGCVDSSHESLRLRESMRLPKRANRYQEYFQAMTIGELTVTGRLRSGRKNRSRSGANLYESDLYEVDGYDPRARHRAANDRERGGIVTIYHRKRCTIYAQPLYHARLVGWIFDRTTLLDHDLLRQLVRGEQCCTTSNFTTHENIKSSSMQPGLHRMAMPCRSWDARCQ